MTDKSSGIDDELLDDDENLFEDAQEKVHDSQWAPHGSKPVCVQVQEFIGCISSDSPDVFSRPH